MKVTVVIEKNNTGLFSAFVEDDLPDFALNGQGFTVDGGIGGGVNEIVSILLNASGLNAGEVHR